MTSRIVLFFVGLGLGLVLARQKPAERTLPTSGASNILISGAWVSSGVSTPPSAPPAESHPETLREGALDALETLRALKEASARQVSFSFDAFENEKLTEGAIKLFQLTESEAQAINALMRDVRNQIDQLALKVASAEIGDDKTVVIKVLPFPETGGKLYDLTMRRMNEILGPRRSELFVELGQVGKLFTAFGAGKREIKIKRVKEGPDIAAIYLLQAEWTQPSSISEGRIIFNSSADDGRFMADREAVVNQLGSIAEFFLPPDF